MSLPSLLRAVVRQKILTGFQLPEQLGIFFLHKMRQQEPEVLAAIHQMIDQQAPRSQVSRQGSLAP
jgi:hypothetical protein